MERIYVIFGAGRMGGEAYFQYSRQGIPIRFFIDNDAARQGGEYCGVPIISLNTLVKQYRNSHIIVACRWQEVLKQLKENGVQDYELYDAERFSHKTRLLSYSQPDQLEDVILYHVFREADEVFYIDVGANDPVIGSVTKLLYDRKNARGINIEPLKGCYRLLEEERGRDINLCCGCGEKRTQKSFYVQGGYSTTKEENVLEPQHKEEIIEIYPLSEICRSYLAAGQRISFLKIDVEGGEREVLEGADFDSFRPAVICIEATLPGTDEWCHDRWESLLLKAEYDFTYSYGVNRYYVAREEKALKVRFLPVPELRAQYEIYSAGFKALV